MRSLRRTLKACIALFMIRVAERIQYRAAALANSSTTIFWGILHVVLLTVFFTFGREQVAAISLTQAITYMWLAQILLGLIAMPYSGIDDEFRKKITDGDVAVELCRPLDLYAFWYAKTAANKLGGNFWRVIFTALAALLAPAAFRLSLPDSAAGFALFLLSVISAFVLSAAFAMMLTAIRMGLTWGDGPISSLALVGMLLSGSYFPLPLWPDFMQRILLLQPFAGILDIPLRLYIGSILPADAFWAIGLQVIWAAAFILLGKILMNRQLARLIVQGG